MDRRYGVACVRFAQWRRFAGYVREMGRGLDCFFGFCVMWRVGLRVLGLVGFLYLVSGSHCAVSVWFNMPESTMPIYILCACEGSISDCGKVVKQKKRNCIKALGNGVLQSGSGCGGARRFRKRIGVVSVRLRNCLAGAGL